MIASLEGKKGQTTHCAEPAIWRGRFVDSRNKVRAHITIHGKGDHGLKAPALCSVGRRDDLPVHDLVACTQWWGDALLHPSTQISERPSPSFCGVGVAASPATFAILAASLRIQPRTR